MGVHVFFCSDVLSRKIQGAVGLVLLSFLNRWSREKIHPIFRSGYSPPIYELNPANHLDSWLRDYTFLAN